MFFCWVRRNSAGLPDRCLLSGQPSFRPALTRSGGCPITQAVSRSWRDLLPSLVGGKPPQEVGEGSLLDWRHVEEGHTALKSELPGVLGAVLDPNDGASDHLRGQGERPEGGREFQHAGGPRP